MTLIRSMLGPLAIGILMALMMLGASFFYAGCGKPAHLEPPNTQQACDRMLSCSLIEAADVGQCVTCFEHVDPAQVEAVKVYLGGELPDDFAKVPCWQAALVMTTNMKACIVERWHWK